jgi:hypothetical protein
MSTQRSQPSIREKKTGRFRRAASRPAGSSQKAALDRFDQTYAALRVGPHAAERELVDHPAHYGGDTPHEVIKCLEAWGLELDALLWNAVKYIARANKKAFALQDLEKALFYLERRINYLRGQDPQGQDAQHTPLKRYDTIQGQGNPSSLPRRKTPA